MGKGKGKEKEITDGRPQSRATVKLSLSQIRPWNSRLGGAMGRGSGGGGGRGSHDQWGPGRSGTHRRGRGCWWDHHGRSQTPPPPPLGGSRTVGGWRKSPGSRTSAASLPAPRLPPSTPWARPSAPSSCSLGRGSGGGSWNCPSAGGGGGRASPQLPWYYIARRIKSRLC